MDCDELKRRLIVNADDFGRSSSINRAVIEAHQKGILTSASLMVNEGAAPEAIALARENVSLGVGLHLALVCGKSALPHSRIPNLVDGEKNFHSNAVIAGLKYFFSKKIKAQLQAEIEAQFEKFSATGLKLDHVNGHLHIHLHPVVFGILMANAEKWGIKQIRLTRDPFWFNAKLAPGKWIYRASHSLIYRFLSFSARPQLKARNIRHTDFVFGLLQNADVNREYLRRLLEVLPVGDNEVYSHPSMDTFAHELAALTDPEIKALVKRRNIQLIRYQDL